MKKEGDEREGSCETRKRKKQRGEESANDRTEIEGANDKARTEADNNKIK